jgi:hypothetical protein
VRAFVPFLIADTLTDPPWRSLTTLLTFAPRARSLAARPLIHDVIADFFVAINLSETLSNARVEQRDLQRNRLPVQTVGDPWIRDYLHVITRDG